MSDSWYKVDNVAKVFLATASQRDPRVFRISCTLNEEIDQIMDELLARLRVTFRRISMLQNAAGCSVFTNGDLQIDFAAGCATLKGQELHLTPIEYRLLCVMAKNCGKVLTHTYITHEVWGSSWDNDVASLRVFMATLRKKLEFEPDSPQYIQTHIGIGYRMLKV